MQGDRGFGGGGAQAEALTCVRGRRERAGASFLHTLRGTGGLHREDRGNWTLRRGGGGSRKPRACETHQYRRKCQYKSKI